MFQWRRHCNTSGRHKSDVFTRTYFLLASTLYPVSPLQNTGFGHGQIFLHDKDPSGISGTGGIRHRHVLMGPLLCRAGNAGDARHAYVHDREWDDFITGEDRLLGV